ncbi:MAG: thiamine pyridinylase [Myxococcota bacterium]
MKLSALRLSTRALWASLLLIPWLGACATPNANTDRKPAPKTSAQPSPQTPTTLRVGLYNYVPRPDQVREAIAKAWAAKHPNVVLQFVGSDEWDGGYGTDPAKSRLDVFVFDAIYLGDWVEAGVIAPLARSDIPHEQDLLPYVAQDLVTPDDAYLGIPMYGCASLLFYRRGDAPLAAATTLDAVTTALGRCTYTRQWPSERRGLMIDLAGGTTNACLYVDAEARQSGQWPSALPTAINPATVSSLRTLLSLSSYHNATLTPKKGYGRAAKFGAGLGRAVVGYTEAMSAMGQGLSDVEFKILPLGGDASTPPLFYADIAAVWSGSAHKALATELVALMTSTEVIVSATGATADQGPQYLMPARKSVFSALKDKFPIYGRMQKMVDDAQRVVGCQ